MDDYNKIIINKLDNIQNELRSIKVELDKILLTLKKYGLETVSTIENIGEWDTRKRKE